VRRGLQAAAGRRCAEALGRGGREGGGCGRAACGVKRAEGSVRVWGTGGSGGMGDAVRVSQ
jgi:hypothetical protein